MNLSSFARRIFRGALNVLALLIILSAVIVGVTRMLTPLLNQYRTNFETWASMAIQRPVTINEVKASWYGYTPHISLQDVTVLNAASHKPMLAAEEIDVNLNLWRSLLQHQWVIQSVTVMGMQLDVTEDVSGKIQIENLSQTENVNNNTVDWDAILHWILTQNRLGLKKINVHYVREDREIFLNLKSLNLFNAGDQHTLIGDAIINQAKPNKLAIRLNGSIAFQKENNTWQVQTNNFEARSADIKTITNLKLIIPADESATIDLTSGFVVNDVSHIPDYLPVNKLDPRLSHWLQTSFIKGSADAGKVIIKGNLKDFPFDNGKGRFSIIMHPKDVTLDFAPLWPPLKHATGELAFVGRSMNIKLQSATIMNIPVVNAHAILPYIGKDHPQILTIDGDLPTNFNAALKFVDNSPLKNSIGNKMSAMNLNGPIALKLNLVIPLGSPKETQVLGNINFNDATLVLKKWNLKLNKLQGGVQFSNQDITAKNIQGEFLESPITLNLTTLHSKSSEDTLQATLTGSISTLQIKKLINTKKNVFADGATQFQVDLYLPLKSDSLDTRLIFQSNLQGVSFNLPLHYGKSKEEAKNFQAEITDTSKLLKIKLSYDHRLHLDFNSLGDANWQAQINSPEALGELTFNEKFSAHPVRGTFQRLSFSTSSKQTESLLNPDDFPALEIDCRSFTLDDKSLGALQLRTSRTLRGMRIDALQLHSDLIDLQSQGSWNNHATNLQGIAKTSKLSDLLNELGFHSKNFIAQEGEFNFDLTSATTPYNFSINDMSGTLKIKIGKGRVLETGGSDAQIGLGHLLTIFSLSTLPRRLSLDFSDVFEKGYSFDTVTGDFNFKRGNATTDNLRFDGPIAKIHIAGRIGLRAKDLDVKLSVTPYVTSSLPVVAAIAVNPVVGVATWVVSRVINRVVSKVTTYHYMVTGSWDNPVWTKTGVETPAKNNTLMH